MLIEHRTYSLKEARMESFWQAQRDRGYELVQPILDRLIGYFSTASGPESQIVHLYRYDSYDDWATRLQGLYTVSALEPYFKTARKLLVAQENKFLCPAPINVLTPFWGNGNNWLPGDRCVASLEAEPGLLVEESVCTLLPGSLPLYWQAYRNHGIEAAEIATDHLLACFVSLVGKQHQVIHYRWYRDFTERQQHRAAQLNSAHWQAFIELTAPSIVCSENRLLEPSKIAQLSPLFSASDSKEKTWP